MERSEISTDEKQFIIEGVEMGIRNDGRRRMQYRPIEIEVDYIKKCMGSAYVAVGDNIIVATVKGDLFTPSAENARDGLLEFRIDCSPEVKSRSVWGKVDSLKRLEYVLMDSYSNALVGNSDLCILEGVKCWRLDVTVLIVAAGGSVYDTAGMAVQCALSTTRLPAIKEIEQDGDEYEVKIDDDPLKAIIPKFGTLPNIITLCKVGSVYIVDPSYEEALCSELKFVCTLNNRGKIIAMFKDGSGCVHPSSHVQMSKMAEEFSKTFSKEILGFLSEQVKHLEAMV